VAEVGPSRHRTTDLKPLLGGDWNGLGRSETRLLTGPAMKVFSGDDEELQRKASLNGGRLAATTATRLLVRTMDYSYVTTIRP